ncbi:MAG: hypothetical protein MJZ65_05495, partial [Paludibacteraceae bacterium]|nr:hypothetical protein [Paludibacteraceae bacterium]
HQLWIRLPKCWRWLEPLVARLHAHIYNRYDEVWVPDYENGEWRMENGEWKMENGEWRMENGEWKTENGEWRMENGEWKTLSGILGHPNGVWRMENGERRMENGEWRMEKVRYIGPLSRFTNSPIHRFTDSPYHTVALLSGLEPQRSIFEQQVMAQMAQQKGKHLLVQGKVKEPFTKLQHGNITIVPWLGDDELAEALVGAEQIICRSGYSTIMDLDRLGILDKAVFYPTPGQPEQEYLASLV